LLTDLFFLKTNIIPFTEARVPMNNDLAFVLLRYIVFFPVLVFTTVDSELWVEDSAGHLIITASLIVAAHIAFSHAHARIIAKGENQNGFDEEPRLFQTLGLRNRTTKAIAHRERPQLSHQLRVKALISSANSGQP
jgi:hypothetical protein